jgi:hypothetical protein
MNRYRVRADVFTHEPRQHDWRPRPRARRSEQAGLIVHLPRREPVSPELVLVDPELAALERLRLHEPGWFAPAGAGAAGALRLAPAAPATAADSPVVEVAATPAEPVGPAFTFRPRWALEGGMQRVGLDWPLVRPSRWDALADESLFRPPHTADPVARPNRRHLVRAATTVMLGVGGASLLWLLAEQTPQPTLEGRLPIIAAPAPQPPGPTPPPVAAPRQPPATSAPRSPTPAEPTLVPPVSVPESPPAPAPAPPAAKPNPVASAAATPPPAAQPPAPPAAPVPASGGTRTLAWAPVTGASGYQVELFRGSRRVLSERTREPRLEVGGSWRHEGQTYSFERGSYWWYVWPVLQDGTRGGVATVRARLVIGPS